MAHEDAEYTDWIRRQPCTVCGKGPSQAHHHTGRRGMGQKVHDRQTIPLCPLCHRQFHDASGWAKTMDKAARRAWQDDKVRFYQRLKGQTF